MKLTTISLLFSLSLSAANPFRTLAHKVKENPNKSMRMMLVMEAATLGMEILKYKTYTPKIPSVTIFAPGQPTVGAPVK